MSSPFSASVTSSGTAAPPGTPGSVVLQIKSVLSLSKCFYTLNSISVNFLQYQDSLTSYITNNSVFLSLSLSQVAQVLLTLPYSFSQLGLVSGIVFQVFYGLVGSWTAYLISVLYIEYRSRKEKEGASFKNHVIQVIN